MLFRSRSAIEFYIELCSSEATVEAIAADGWPVPMARRGLEMHKRTWDPESVAAVVEDELAPFGGTRALVESIDSRRVVAPGRINHIWPALPGAGVTPVLFGYLIGAEQGVRGSSRGRVFAKHFVDTWRDVLGENLELIDPDWWDADVVVVSGSDQTVADVSDIARQRGGDVQVTGYGHRVSFAVVVDEDTSFEAHAPSLATDIVMWHQRGCFSCRSVVFVGSKARCERFCRHLADEIAQAEHRLGADDVSEGELARRAQARGTAEFAGPVWGDGVGWTTMTDQPWAGDAPSAHAVTVHRIDGIDELSDVVDVEPRHLQGVALSVPPTRRDPWQDALVDLGVTRICEPGLLQQPPASWPHDGRPNILDWMRIVHLDRTD